MKIEHYPSLELCKKLTYIGFPETENIRYEDDKKGIWYNSPECYEWDYACPSVMEMLDVIPSHIDSHYRVIRTTGLGKYCIGYECDDGYENEELEEQFFGEFPNALAEMILWLHENEHITF